MRAPDAMSAKYVHVSIYTDRKILTSALLPVLYVQLLLKGNAIGQHVSVPVASRMFADYIKHVIIKLN